MINSDLLQKIKTQAGQGLNINVVEGLRTENLPTPCISIVPVDMDRFSASLVDVFNCNVSVKYEEHYADITTEKAKANFDQIVRNFSDEELTQVLQGTTYHVFDARLESATSEVVGDFIVQELYLRIIAELQK